MRGKEERSQWRDIKIELVGKLGENFLPRATGSFFVKSKDQGKDGSNGICGKTPLFHFPSTDDTHYAIKFFLERLTAL